MTERTYECEKCHHVYTERYGREVEIPGGVEWRCFACIEAARWKKAKKS